MTWFPGTPESAPAKIDPKRVVIMTTIVAALVYGLVRLVIYSKWISLDTLGVPGG